MLPARRRAPEARPARLRRRCRLFWQRELHLLRRSSRFDSLRGRFMATPNPTPSRPAASDPAPVALPPLTSLRALKLPKPPGQAAAPTPPPTSPARNTLPDTDAPPVPPVQMSLDWGDEASAASAGLQSWDLAPQPVPPPGSSLIARADAAAALATARCAALRSDGPNWPVSAAAADRRGRHGPGLPGRGHLPEAASGAEGHEAGRGQGRTIVEAILE